MNEVSNKTPQAIMTTSSPLHSNPRPRPSDEELAAQRSRKREQEILLRKKPLVEAVEEAMGGMGSPISSPERPKPNIRSHYQTIEEERLAREQAVTGSGPSPY
jgi:hypothetical protein